MRNYRMSVVVGLSLAMFVSSYVQSLVAAGIYRWDTGELIPGTEDLVPAPGAQLAYRDLPYAELGGADLANANMRNANLNNASLAFATLTNADLTDAMIAGADVSGAGTPYGLSKEQLYSTASYKNFDLAGLQIGYFATRSLLTGWDFSHQNLTNAVFGDRFNDVSGYTNLIDAKFVGAILTGTHLGGTILKDADFFGATINGAQLWSTTRYGFTKEQLYATASYQQRTLYGLDLEGNNLAGWDLSGQDLTDANLNYTTLANANLSGTIVAGTALYGTVHRGFTKEQLYSTASYQQKNLQGIALGDNVFAGWDFSGQNLSDAYFPGAQLANANLSGANLTNAYLLDAKLANANLSFADMRGGIAVNFRGDNPGNFIRPDGHINGLTIDSGQLLIIRDYDGDFRDDYHFDQHGPIAITVQDHLTVAPSAVLQLVFEADSWDSLISFDTGIPIQLGGTLALTFADDVGPTSQVGRTFQLFDWTGVNPTGVFSLVSPYSWDTSRLYASGEVTLLAIPEPSCTALAALMIGLSSLRVRFDRRPGRGNGSGGIT